jgi:hypothetical protein
MQQTEICDFIP